ncbi:hypothetical protein [Spiroplasma endosymbiont of Aspidapion aeneum]|uniref:hypothetical protein n=1 Tax=Spiroplasma endosymbiont of Aspidapion aeneum TaxID=3066276 RepID=UPI00313BB012
MNKKHLPFFIYFAVIPLLSVISDLIFSVTNPPKTDSTYYFDFSLINQIVYFSVWVSITTSVVGIYLIIWYCKGEYEKISNFNVMMTTIISFNSVIFLVYWLGLVFSPKSIQGFSTPYKIIKSIVEHGITPLLFIFYYFFIWKNDKKYSTIDYIKYKSWYLAIIPGIYIIFYVTRSLMIHNYGRENDYIFNSNPYAQTNMWDNPIYKWLPIMILQIIVPAAFGIFYNYLSNINNIKFLDN